MENNVLEFLRQSNFIESEYDDIALEDAVKAWEYVQTQDVMTPEVVKKTHEILMERRPLEQKFKGEFRDCPVYVGGHAAMNARKIPEAVDAWCELMNAPNPGEEEWQEICSKAFHVQYENIHPFADGNGRTGRIFMNWWRLRHDLPVLVIHADYPDPLGEQMEYYSWFRK